MADAIGPIYSGGGFEAFEINERGEGYKILYLPDKNNYELQQEGEPPVYYWVPEKIRLAQNPETKEYKFRQLHYIGDPNPFDDEKSIVGGHVAFTTTISPPPTVLQASQEKLLQRFRGTDDKYWGWTTSVSPQFRIIPITNNITRIQGNTGDEGWKLDGEGAGSITGGENAYSGLLNALYSELLWAGFHGTSSPIAINQVLEIPVWTEKIYLKITGNWDRIFQHFSASVSSRTLWTSKKISHEFNSLLINGGIKVEMRLDGTFPDADEMRKLMEQHQELILTQFMDQAKRIIFDPEIPSIEPAKSERGFWGFGSGYSLKSVLNTTNLDLSYEETLEYKYNREFPISSSLQGLHDLVIDNPEEEKKYFERVLLGDLSKLIPIKFKSVVNWPNPDKNFTGEPISFTSAQIGYPDKTGKIDNERNYIFNKGEADLWEPEPIVMLRPNEAAPPPEGWDTDKVFVRRKLHFIEPPSESEFPFLRYKVEKNVVELDPEGGTLTSDYILEVRADQTGILDVGPITLGVIMKEGFIVEVEFKAEGRTDEGNERPITKIQWDYETRNEKGYWKIYTGQLDFKPLYKYRVRVIQMEVIGGSEDGGEWQGPWEDCAGNGSLILKIPKRR